MTTSRPRIAVTQEWKDIAAEDVNLASVEIRIQNDTGQRVDVVWGGATEPTDQGPDKLAPDDSVTGTAANVWVRCQGEGFISATIV